MNMIEIIAKKRDKQVLSTEEIQFWIDGIVNKSIPDYQSSALLMAIVLNSMETKEVADLTEAMMKSGDILDLSQIGGIKVDKHSTGGVGDKTSIVLTPLVASCGVKVAKMSGRGLGHTGGTLDKLESIEGFDIFLDNDEFVDVVNTVGCSIIGQTANLVPADKTLYALRDVTSTVQSIPLIASSIMSKKLAASTDTILLDVKVGDGAFMKTIEQATALSEAMIEIGRHLNKDVRAILSNMNQPLGSTIGNALEIKEAVLTLQNKGPKDFKELCLDAASIMLTQAKVVSNYEEGYKLAQQKLQSGEAYAKLLEWISAQKGNIEVIKDLSKLPQSKYVTELNSEKSGFINEIKTEQLGHLSMLLGGGRQTKDDVINYAVGLELVAKTGQKVQIGEPIIKIYHDKDLTEQLIRMAHDSYVIENTIKETDPLILKVID
ncbi:MAG: thymidine phosphorylase [Erysipelothrix sp.]|nr:thymidine phosphorylase [Erysipelothrix sp.]